MRMRTGTRQAKLDLSHFQAELLRVPILDFGSKPTASTSRYCDSLAMGRLPNHFAGGRADALLRSRATAGLVAGRARIVTACHTPSG